MFIPDPGSDFFHPVSRIRTVSIPDPGVKKVPYPESRIRIRNTDQKGDESRRSVYKNRFWVIASNGVSKNPSFHNDLKNVHKTLVKSVPKKSFAQKNLFF
jgi:hypothetical protein